MKNFVDTVTSVSDWAEVVVRDGMMPYAKRSLTIRPKVHNGGVKIQAKTKVSLYQYRNDPDKRSNVLYVPRAIVGGRLRIPMQGKWPRLNAKSIIEKYRPGQLETIMDFELGLKMKSAYGGILKAVTGAGKTVMGIDLASRLGLKTLIIVPRSSLMEQWKERIMEYTNCEEDDIGIIRGPKAQYKDKKFVVGMIHTMSQQITKYPEKFFSAFGTVIFDEVHVVGAETFSRVAPMFHCRYRIGLSATLRRSDGMESVFWWHIGPELAKFTKLQAEPRIRVLPYHGRDTSHAGCVWGGNLNLGRYHNRIAKSPERMELLRKLVVKLSKNKHDVLVLSDRIIQLERLRELLIQSGVEDDKIGMLIGKKKQLDRKIILGTYGSAGMGVDIPRLSALVMATPRAEIEQAVGRVLRKGSPVIVDIVDTSSKIMQKWAWKRMRYYKKISKDIVDKTRG